VRLAIDQAWQSPALIDMEAPAELRRHASA
jgi:hypothetical protein